MAWFTPFKYPLTKDRVILQVWSLNFPPCPPWLSHSHLRTSKVVTALRFWSVSLFFEGSELHRKKPGATGGGILDLPSSNQHSNGKSTIWRCISYWNRWISIAMLVFSGGVMSKKNGESCGTKSTFRVNCHCQCHLLFVSDSNFLLHYELWNFPEKKDLKEAEAASFKKKYMEKPARYPPKRWPSCCLLWETMAKFL